MINFLITFFYLTLILFVAVLLRKRFTDQATVRYFIPALGIKLFGALALGLIYEFYYGYGGDTFGYYFQPGTVISGAFVKDPLAWFKLVFFPNVTDPDTYGYARTIFTFHDTPTYFIARIVGFFGVFTFNSYYATALFFAVLSFSGIWVLYKSFYKLYPNLHFQFAIACLFVPSVWFWGSGILKDTITLSAVGWFIYATFEMLFHRRYSFLAIVSVILSGYILYTVKIYILMCLVPSFLLMYGFTNYKRIRNPALRLLSLPVLVLVVTFGGFYGVQRISETSQRYSLDNLAFTASETAQWLEYVGEQQAGSVYTLGDNDFSTTGIIRNAPLAIITGLFRPFIWESGNPVMFLSGLENLLILGFLIMILFKVGLPRFLWSISSNQLVLFCFFFSVIFAFAVGIATYNFGSLVRYRIPLIPLFLSAIYITNYLSKKQVGAR